MASKVNQPFTEREKAELDNCPKCNEFLKRLDAEIYKNVTEDFRLTHVRGNRITIKNLAYPGHGVKVMQFVLRESGVEILHKWQQEQGEASKDG